MSTPIIDYNFIENFQVVVIIVDFDVVVDVVIMFLINVADHIVLSWGQ